MYFSSSASGKLNLLVIEILASIVDFSTTASACVALASLRRRRRRRMETSEKTDVSHAWFVTRVLVEEFKRLLCGDRIYDAKLRKAARSRDCGGGTFVGTQYVIV